MKDNLKSHSMLKYLEEKYDKKFQMDAFIEGSYAFPEMYGGDKIIAYPEDRPQELFIAYESSKQEKVFYDNYLLSMWAEQIRNEKATSVKELFKEKILFNTVFNAAYDKYDASMKDMKAGDYLKSNNDVNLTFKIAVICPASPEIEKYKEQLFKLYAMVKAFNTTEYSISVAFVDSGEDFSDYIRTSGVNNTSWNNINKKIFGYIVVDEAANILKSEDLLKYYREVEE